MMTSFTIYTSDTAPEAAKEALKTVHGKMGFVPNVLAEMAESPIVLKSYLALAGATGQGTLSQTEIYITQLVTSCVNGCNYCLAAKSTFAQKSGVAVDILEALKTGVVLQDAKLQALRVFTKSVAKKEPVDLDAFLKAGYTKAQSLEVILNVAVSTVTNLVNHIAKTPVDSAFEANKVCADKVEKVTGDSCCSGKTSCAA
jgi:AhpD family alkylhydroperoxidase